MGFVTRRGASGQRERDSSCAGSAGVLPAEYERCRADGPDGGVLYAAPSVTDVVEKNLLLPARYQCSQQLCRCQGHISRENAATPPDVRDLPGRPGSRVDRRLQVEGRAATPPVCAAPTRHT